MLKPILRYLIVKIKSLDTKLTLTKSIGVLFKLTQKRIVCGRKQKRIFYATNRNATRNLLPLLAAFDWRKARTVEWDAAWTPWSDWPKCKVRDVLRR